MASDLIHAQEAQRRSARALEKLAETSPYVSCTIQKISEHIQRCADMGVNECTYPLGNAYDALDARNTDGTVGRALFTVLAKMLRVAGYIVDLQCIQGNAVYQLNVKW